MGLPRICVDDVGVLQLLSLSIYRCFIMACYYRVEQFSCAGVSLCLIKLVKVLLFEVPIQNGFLDLLDSNER